MVVCSDGVFGTHNIEDIMAYLLTLKKDPPPGTVKKVQQISFEQ